MAELLANADRCPPETDDTAIICSGECQSYFDNFVRYCAPDVCTHNLSHYHCSYSSTL